LFSLPIFILKEILDRKIYIKKIIHDLIEKQFLNITVKNKTVIFKTKSNIDYPTYVLDKKNTSLIYIATNILLR
jgi:hypothetical protein